MRTEEKVKAIIDEIRPYLMNDGGNIEFIKCENNIVYIRLSGACLDCQMIDFTLKESIESAIKEECPEILQIVNIT